jgi:hypothetical protein
VGVGTVICNGVVELLAWGNFGTARVGRLREGSWLRALVELRCGCPRGKKRVEMIWYDYRYLVGVIGALRNSVFKLSVGVTRSLSGRIQR